MDGEVQVHIWAVLWRRARQGSCRHEIMWNAPRSSVGRTRRLYKERRVEEEEGAKKWEEKAKGRCVKESELHLLNTREDASQKNIAVLPSTIG